jgi:hypothetical protein
MLIFMAAWGGGGEGWVGAEIAQVPGDVGEASRFSRISAGFSLCVSLKLDI